MLDDVKWWEAIAFWGRASGTGASAGERRGARWKTSPGTWVPRVSGCGTSGGAWAVAEPK